MKFWQTIHEPKVVTSFMVAAYFIALVTGVWMILTPPAGDIIDIVHDARTITGLFFVTGGALGVPGAWRGEWWAEKAAVYAVAGAVLTHLIQVWGDLVQRGSFPIVYVALHAFTLLFLSTRYVRVKDTLLSPAAARRLAHKPEKSKPSGELERT